MRPTPDSRGGESGAAPAFASLGDRFVAQAVDGLVAFGVFFFVGMVVAPRFGGATESGFELTGGPALLTMAIVAFVLFAYFTVAEAAWGATLGKRAAGIEVETTDGQRIGVLASLVRNVARVIDGIGVYLVGAIVAAATARHQRLGDLAAGTVVVRRASGRGQRVGAILVALAVAAAGVAGGFWLRGRSLPLTATAEAAAEPHQTLDQYRPKGAGAALKAVSLSASDRDAFDPGRVATELAEGVEQLQENGQTVTTIPFRIGTKTGP